MLPPGTTTKNIENRIKDKEMKFVYLKKSEEEIEEEIKERDYRDMHREQSPLRQAEDAVLLDTSQMDPEQVTERIIAIAKERGLEI